MPMVRKTLTQADVRLYLKEGGYSCPFCRESDIQGGPFTADRGKAFQEMTCTDCGEVWEDEYTLTSVAWEWEGKPDGK